MRCVALETLGPTERAVFVLSEVFGHSHRDIAWMIGKSDTAVRQIAHRARSGFPEPPFRRCVTTLTRDLETKGFDVVDCRGFDTWRPLRLVGGIRKATPMPAIPRPRAFAENLQARTTSAP
ncbi:sigma factor-like helix-turn-helix DNA-binding protein [Nocardia fluminea]|uniref:sigma factor-like helix-turn-helix DNA-binding protein n=1 Tax=Nocardia fluminea TaxID=134984 RepID=UPI003F4D5D8B